MGRIINNIIHLPLVRPSLILRNIHLGKRKLPHQQGTKLINKGISYVSWPRLNPPIEVLQYTGPGVHGTQRGRGMTFAGMVPFLNKSSTGVKKGEEVELGRRKGALID